jgi:hypothetical protein
MSSKSNYTLGVRTYTQYDRHPSLPSPYPSHAVLSKKNKRSVYLFLLALAGGQPVKSDGAIDRAVADQQGPEGKRGGIPGLLEPGGI